VASSLRPRRRRSDLLVKVGHVTKYAKGKIDLQAEIDTAWEALFENLEGRVVFRDDE
jgi:hypothetical protein